MAFAFKDSKGTRYLPHFDFDENDEVTTHFTPVVEHQKLTGPLLVPADVLGAVREAVQSMWDELRTLSFNDGLALVERETRRLCRLIAGSKFMNLIRKRPAYRPIPITRISPRRVRIRAPRRSRRSAAVASRGGGDDGGGGESDQSDPSRPRLNPVLGTEDVTSSILVPPTTDSKGSGDFLPNPFSFP